MAERIDVRGVIATVIADLRASGETGMVENLQEADAEFAKLMIERDSLRAALKDYQDGRRFSNLHTRQVARDIERAADVRISLWSTP